MTRLHLIAVCMVTACSQSHLTDVGTDSMMDAPVIDAPMGPDVERRDSPTADCGPEVTDRNVGVLYVMQSFGLVLAVTADAYRGIDTLMTRLRETTSGTIRFAAINGNSGPGGLRGNGCEVEGRDGLFLSAGDGGDSIVTLPPGGSIESFVAGAQAILSNATNDQCVNEVLESTMRAITPSTVPVTLPAHGSVHGDRENAGLVGPGDILLVVFVTDAEDCSWNETVTSTLPDGLVPCPRPGRCCPAVLYPSAERYVPIFREAAEALDVDLAFALISGIPEADVSLEEWRARGEPELCAPDTPVIYAHMPWRILETLDYFEPFVTTQPRCDPDYQAIADLIPQLACATR